MSFRFHRSAMFLQIDVCEKLFLKTIKYALRVIPSEKVLRFEQSKNDVIDRTVLYGERVILETIVSPILITVLLVTFNC
jgi:hypothetical protein